MTSASQVRCAPAYWALMTLSNPIPASERTRMKSIQSKCSMYLRSPLGISAALLSLRRRAVFEHPRYLGLRRLGMQLKVPLEDVVNHRRGRTAAVTAVLDDTSGRYFRMFFRRERDEPCVILILLGRLVVFAFAFPDWRDVGADGLRGAGLAANDNVVEFCLMCGAARAVDDVGHRVFYRCERSGIDRDSSFNFRRIRLGDGAVETFDSLDKLRPVAGSAVGDDLGNLRHLQRRCRYIALADRRPASGRHHKSKRRMSGRSRRAARCCRGPVCANNDTRARRTIGRRGSCTRFA